VKVGYVQFRPKFGDKEYNVSKMIDMASTLDAEVIVFPELANTGYVFKSKEEIVTLAEPYDGPSIKRMQEFSKRKGALLAFGFAERFGDVFYNSAAVTNSFMLMVCRKISVKI